jgi:hypothetical protein
LLESARPDHKDGLGYQAPVANFGIPAEFASTSTDLHRSDATIGLESTSAAEACVLVRNKAVHRVLRPDQAIDTRHLNRLTG